MPENLKLRMLEAYPVEYEGRKMIMLPDPERLGDNGIKVTLPGYYLMNLMDGTRTNEQIIESFENQFGQTVQMDDLIELAGQLDQAYLFDNQRYADYKKNVIQQFRDSVTRPAVFAGKSYSEDPDELLKSIEKMIGKPGPKASGDLKAIVVPHIDFSIGGDMMASGWREVMETDAELFVILGTGHSMKDDFFSCIDKDFETPIGTMKVDHDFLSKLNLNFGEGLFDHVEAHRSEHSIEFQSLFMAWLARSRLDIKAVPILLSYPEGAWNNDDPIFNGERIDWFIDALGRTAKADARKVIFVASVDFSHVGSRFGDEEKLSEKKLKAIETDDRALLERVSEIDPSGFLNRIVDTNPTNRVCGFPALYTLLKLTDAKKGKLSEYRQNIEGEMDTMVSFATMSLY